MVPMEASTEILKLNKIEKFDDKFVITNREPDKTEKKFNRCPVFKPIQFALYWGNFKFKAGFSNHVLYLK